MHSSSYLLAYRHLLLRNLMLRLSYKLLWLLMRLIRLLPWVLSNLEVRILEVCYISNRSLLNLRLNHFPHWLLTLHHSSSTSSLFSNTAFNQSKSNYSSCNNHSNFKIVVISSSFMSSFSSFFICQFLFFLWKFFDYNKSIVTSVWSISLLTTLVILIVSFVIVTMIISSIMRLGVFFNDQRCFLLTGLSLFLRFNFLNCLSLFLFRLFGFFLFNWSVSFLNYLFLFFSISQKLNVNLLVIKRLRDSLDFNVLSSDFSPKDDYSHQQQNQNGFHSTQIKK